MSGTKKESGEVYHELHNEAHRDSINRNSRRVPQ